MWSGVVGENCVQVGSDRIDKVELIPGRLFPMFSKDVGHGAAAAIGEAVTAGDSVTAEYTAATTVGCVIE